MSIHTFKKKQIKSIILYTSQNYTRFIEFDTVFQYVIVTIKDKQKKFFFPHDECR